MTISNYNIFLENTLNPGPFLIRDFYHRDCRYSKTTGATSEAGTA